MKKKTQKMAVILLVTASLIFGCCACAKDPGTTTGNETAQSNTGETAAQSNTSKSEGTILAEQVKVGDYVNYNAASGDGAGKLYITEESLTGSSVTAPFSTTDPMLWKVMSVDKDTGTVELMSAFPTPEQLTLCGKTGYKNAEKVLNDIGAVYGYGDGATGGRSITIEDVNKLENYTPEDSTTSFAYTEGTFINDDGTEVTATEDNPVTMSYTASTAEKSTNRSYRYETTNFSEKTFWLASRYVTLDPELCFFGVRIVEEGKVYVGDLTANFDVEYSTYYPALPIVTLEANIMTSGQDENGAWNLIIE